MRLFLNATARAVFAVLIVSSVAFSAPRETARGAVRGEVTDLTGGVLPGVSVVSALPGGQVLDSTVTDAEGSYRFSALPAGAVTLIFQLDGIAPNALAISVQTKSETIF